MTEHHDAVEEVNLSLASIREKVLGTKVVLSDIEGTTTSIPYVRTVLKSYAKLNMSKYICGHWEDTELMNIRREMESLGPGGDSCAISSIQSKFEKEEKKSEKELIEDYVLRECESKQAAYSIKYLQTKVWEEGYLCSALKGHLFPDVTPAFKNWNEQGLHVYMYSSGIQLAQKLLFTHSSEGDVHELISGYFDLDIGPKVDPESYKKIMEKVDCQPNEALFLTDNIQEADAAQKAGMVAILVLREGNEPIDAKYCKLFPTIYSFEEVTALLSKRKLSSTDESDKVIFNKKTKLDS